MHAERHPSLVWFRRDLRLQDNRALRAAIAGEYPVTALYIHDPQADGQWAPGAASRWYLHHSLLSLQRELAAIGIPLTCLAGPTLESLPRFAQAQGIERIFWNQVIEPNRLAEERRLSNELRKRGIANMSFHDDSLLPLSEVGKKDGTPYKVFTPFWRHVHGRLSQSGMAHRLFDRPNTPWTALAPEASQIDGLALLDSHPWHHKLSAHWQPGESAAHSLLHDFLEQVASYDQGRDFPAQPATSRLSPALHFGEISVARVFDICQTLLVQESRKAYVDGIQRFLSEIGWREFARHVLHAFPQTPDRSLNGRFEREGTWIPDPDGSRLSAWQRGETGVALVDAGMHQLWETGWMHNRVRMVVASFLTKNLGIHWREGARWFWDTLVDADLPSNTLGWQWVAGCGTDAAPYYRIFNPDTQAGKFDPEQRYLRCWLNDEASYPAIVDLKTSRAQALERYQAVIRRATPSGNGM